MTKGIIKTNEGTFVVVDTIKLHGTMVGHVGYVSEGMIQVGDKVTLKVDSANRNAIAKNHSATHLLQKALKLVLGNHVEQVWCYFNAKAFLDSFYSF